MKAAIDLFKERGYDGTRIIDIAMRAGIGKGTVYEYFSRKEDLMLDVIKDIVLVDYMEFYSEAAMLTEEAGIRKRLDVYLSGSEKMIERYGLYAKMFFNQVVENTDVDSAGAMKVVKEMTDDQWERIRTIISDEAKRRERSGLPPMDEAAVEKATSVTVLLIASYMLNLINDKQAGSGEAIYSKGLAIDREMIVDYIVKGIGF